jgi:hypothetical protein
MIISESDAIWAADEFINYYKKFTSIEDYLRFTKRAYLPPSNPLFPLSGDIFNEDMSPQDMEFDIRFVGERFKNSLPQEYYHNMLSATSSALIESSIPGRELKWIIYERNTQLIVGFIRFGSPTINSRPRNIWLGGAPDLSLLNKHTVMGFNIVPTQPFGYNYLGGKLLTLICCSHFAREHLSTIFEKPIAVFETTSLYGSTSAASQYDGLKPFIRFKGLTDSKFAPLLHNEVFHRLHDQFTIWNDNKPLTEVTASGKKLKRQTKMVSIIRNSLKDEEKLKKFNEVIAHAFGLTEQKRFYTSDYGYSNVREVLLGEQDTLVKGQNWDKFYLENIIQWWKRKATKRYEKLKKDGRIRNRIELWTEDDNIQIIR